MTPLLVLGRGIGDRAKGFMISKERTIFLNGPNAVLNSAGGVDVMGDIHGNADALEGAFTHLGYHKEGETTWRPSEDRVALFVGDLIDRGPANRRVVDIVRGMTERNEAVCLMGNHELNAVHFAMEDGQGGHLRTRSDKNFFQHIHFLIEYAGQSGRDALTRDLDWFKTLPLWVETDAFRAVHACWSPSHVEALRPHAHDPASRGPAFWRDAADKKTELGAAVEVALKGLEEALPHGISASDKDGVTRTDARMRWWTEAHHFLDAALIQGSLSEADQARLAQLAPPECVRDRALVPEKLTFFGHYWMPPKDGPWVYSDGNGVCLDFSVAKGDDGLLGVYRWNGEHEALQGNLLGVDANGRTFASRKVGSALP